ATRDDLEPMQSALVDLGRNLQAAYDAGYWKHGSPIIEADWADWFPGNSPVARAERDAVQRLLYELETFATVCLALLIEADVPDMRSAPFLQLASLGSEGEPEMALLRLATELLRERLIAFQAVAETDVGIAPTAWGQVVYRVGLGPESCALLRDFLHGLAEGAGPRDVRPREVMQQGGREAF